jgi:phosphatidylethanolamine-binding protein (PEBP) family uncharacterized protein
MRRSVTAKAPQLATSTRMTGTTFAILMVDLDIPTNAPPATSTLLHWMQTGLTQSSTATLLNTTAGTAKVFTLQMPGAIAAAAPYLSPAPPALVPLSHRYTQILVDTSTATEASMTVLMTAAQSRNGFNAETVLTQAGLADKVVAGNFYNVTNQGPVRSSTNGTATTGAGTEGSTASPATTTTSVFTGAALLEQANFFVLGFAVVGAGFFCL